MTIDRYGLERRTYVNRYEIWKKNPETGKMELFVKRDMTGEPRPRINEASKSKIKYIRREIREEQNKNES